VAKVLSLLELLVGYVRVIDDHAGSEVCYFSDQFLSTSFRQLVDLDVYAVSHGLGFH
jgi:hypothetical protein